MKLPISLSSTPRPLDVIAVGENSADLVAIVNGHPQANSKMSLADFRELPGGEAASAAVGLARLGWRVAYVGRFGDDRLGTSVRERLRAEGVDISRARVLPDTPNRMALILVDQQTGHRTVLWRRDARLALAPDDLAADVIAQTRVMLVGSDDVAATGAALRTARQHGVRTVGDLERVHAETASLVRELDVIVMAESFPEALTGASSLGAAIREIARESGAALVCVTLGERGCVAVCAGTEIQVPAFEVPVVDTTGAGDLFRAGLIAGWLTEPHQPDVRELLRYASAVAALNCRGMGAFTAAPRTDEVETLLRS